MLCGRCRRQVSGDAGCCGACGAPRPGGRAAPLELRLADGTRIALAGELLIGRAAGSDLRLDDPSVSRRHARVLVGDGGTTVEDVASSHGTWVDGLRVTAPAALRDGARLQLGDQVLEVLRPRAEHEAGRTMVVPAGASLLVAAVGATPVEQAPVAEQAGARPRLRSGHRIKRLAAEEGEGRWVVEDGAGQAARFGDDGRLLELLDGRTALPELVAEAERRLGPGGAARLARLLADLGDRGLLAGVGDDAPGSAAGGRAGGPRPTGWRRLIGPRERATDRAGGVFSALYERGGWLLFTRPALALLALVAACGLVAEVVLIGWRYGTPLIVASHLGLGGLVFLTGRGLLVALHETAHGLALASYGRRAGRAGVRLVAIFPFAFVDTSAAWFEPRRHRLAITLAGPACDLVLAGACALACLVLAEGTARDVLFQVAFAGYLGALLNLNPFLDRDGYHVLVDLVRRPRLRERARAEFARRLAGRGAADRDPALGRFAVAGVVWSVVAALLAIGFTWRYVPLLEAHVPGAVLWTVVATAWAALFVPVLVTVGRPLLARRHRGGTA